SRVQAEIEFVTATGYATPETASVIKSAELTEDPTHLASAARWVNTLRDGAPAASAKVTVGESVETTIALADALGVPIEEAAQLTINQRNLPPEIKERRKDELGDIEVSGEAIIQSAVPNAAPWLSR